MAAQALWKVCPASNVALVPRAFGVRLDMRSKGVPLKPSPSRVFMPFYSFQVAIPFLAVIFWSTPGREGGEKHLK